MLCKNCGKEIRESAAFCPECGTKVEQDKTENTPFTKIGTNSVSSADSAAKSKEDKQNTIIGLVFIAIIIGAIILVCSLIFSGGTASDDDYISAAKTVISKQLKAPSTAIYSDEKIEAQDDYGRTIVSLTVESQNSFGGYVTNSCYILIESYDTDEDTFIYNEVTGVYLSEFGDRYADTYIDKLKESTDWNKPLEE